MAKPAFYPDWANTDVNLPGTGNVNKVRPRETIRTIGWDKGQIPTAEELNWTLNNIGQWMHYFGDEFIPTLPTTYLPNKGTTITFSGDLAGTVTWNGSNQGTGNIQVLDNSHFHLSSNISDATDRPTPNMIVKRSGDAAISAGDIYSYATSAADQATFFLMTQAGQTIGQLSAQSNVGGMTYMYRQNPSNSAVQGWVRIYDDGHTDISLPRTSQGQEGQPNSLVRFDYMWQQLNNTNNNVNNVNNDLQNYKNFASNGFVSSVRLAGGGAADNGNNDNTYARAPNGSVVTAVTQKTNYTAVEFKYLQYLVNGNWYTVGVA